MNSSQNVSKYLQGDYMYVGNRVDHKKQQPMAQQAQSTMPNFNELNRSAERASDN
jgi:hypothetical protein